MTGPWFPAHQPPGGRHASNLTMSAALFIAITLIASMFVLAWVWRRALFLLPSTWVMLLATLVYILPSALLSDQIEDFSPYAITALNYCAVFVMSGMTLNLLFSSPPKLADILPSGLPGQSGGLAGSKAGLRWVLVFLGMISVWYLMNVPLKSTGLYGVLFDPDNAAQLREDSLKLLDNRALQYLYLVGFSSLCPLAFTLLMVRSAQLRGWRRWATVGSVLLFLAFYLLITGARVGLANLAVVGILFAFVRNRLRMGVKPLLAGFALILIVPMLISFLREQGRNEATAFEYVESIGERIFLLPLLISGWYVEYADTRGTVGLMAAMGIGQTVDWTNLIALEYLGRKDSVTIETVTTPTAFIFSNYLYFGWMGLLPSVLALKFIDLPVSRIRLLPRGVRLPFIATLMFFSVIFVQSGFGVTLTSHGYLLLMMLIALIPMLRAPQPAT